MLFGDRNKSSSSKGPPADVGVPSRGLEWLWQQLRDVSSPHVLDCGKLHQLTANVLLARGAKLYVADLLSPLRGGAPDLWDRTPKIPVFRLKELLCRMPSVPGDSVDAIFCWQLFDLVPREALREMMAHLLAYLHSGGVLFLLLREPTRQAGSDAVWWLETAKSMGHEGDSRLPFLYSPVTNRQVEQLVGGASVKTFLTRTGLREVVVTK
jgi:hypothetical protein